MSNKKKQLRGVYINYAGMTAPICTTLSEDDLTENDRCDEKLDAALAWLHNGGDAPAGVETWLRRNRAAALNAMINSDDATALDRFLSLRRRIPSDELLALLDRAGEQNSPDITAYLLQYRRTRYTADELDAFDRRRVEAELGLRELTALEWKKKFRLSYTPDGVFIAGSKSTEDEIVIPARVGNKPVIGVDATMFFGCEPMPHIRRSWANAPAFSDLPSAERGAVMYFGRCTSKKGRAEQPISWRVLAQQEDRILVQSRDAVATLPYHRESREVTWESCDLRRWLNEAFFSIAFTEFEQRLICQTIVRTPDNRHFCSAGGKDTTDRIFLLSLDEVKTYFASDEERAIGSWWWLRSPGFDNAFAAAVTPEGAVVPIGSFVEGDDYMVRPAMWLRAQ